MAPLYQGIPDWPPWPPAPPGPGPPVSSPGRGATSRRYNTRHRAPLRGLGAAFQGKLVMDVEDETFSSQMQGSYIVLQYRRVRNSQEFLTGPPGTRLLSALGPQCSPGIAAVRRACCQAVSALPGRTLMDTVSHRRLGF